MNRYLKSALGIALMMPSLVLAELSGGDKFELRELNKCEAKRKRDNTEAKNRAYDHAFSNYIEVCASTTWQKRGDPLGGNLGHTFSLIRGACLKRDSNNKIEFPQQLIPCKDGVVSISTDYVFKNINWLGTEGRDFALYGEHPADQPFTKEAWMKTQKLAYARGFLNAEAIKYVPEIIGDVVKDSTQYNIPLIDWIQLRGGDLSAGTDFALASARGGVDCTRIPLIGTKPGFENQPLLDIIEEYNDLNRLAWQQGFFYNNMFNSCVTSSHNALASIGFWPRTKTIGNATSITEMISRLKDIQAPYNTMFNAFETGSQFRVGKIVRFLMKNPVAFTRLKKSGWLPHQVGTLLDDVAPIEYRNEIYRTTRKEDFLNLMTALKSIPPVAEKIDALSKKVGVDILSLRFDSNQKKFNTIRIDQDNPSINLLENIRIWNKSYKQALGEVEYLEKITSLPTSGFNGAKSLIHGVTQKVQSLLGSAEQEPGFGPDDLQPGEINGVRKAQFAEVLAELKLHIQAKISMTEKLLTKKELLQPELKLQPIANSSCPD